MTEEEAQALLTALADEFSGPSDDSYVLERRSAVESYTAEQSDDGSWRVLLRWTQGPLRLGAVIDELAGWVMPGPSTAPQVARDLRMFCVEEPHATEGARDGDGRIWLHD